MRSIKGKRQIRKGMYRAEPIKSDPIALSPLGCAHQDRMRTYIGIIFTAHLWCVHQGGGCDYSRTYCRPRYGL